MIEGTPIDSGLVAGRETQDLRRLDWAELVARFAAAHDLRAGLRGHSRRNAGSFARFASRAPETVNTAPLYVNHPDLGHGKTDAATRVDEAQPDKGDAATCDREL